MKVGNEAQRSPPLPRSPVEHERTGLGDGDGAAGEGTVEGVELGHRERGIVDELDPAGTPLLGEIRGDSDPLRAGLPRDPRDPLPDLALARPVHRRAVLRDPLGELVDDRGTFACVRGAVVARDVTRRGAVEGLADAVKDVGPPVAAATGRRVPCPGSLAASAARDGVRVRHVMDAGVGHG